MAILNRTLFFILVFEFLLFFQELKIASAFGTNPNFLLIFSLVLIFTRERFLVIAATPFAVFLIATILIPFWFWPITIFLALMLIADLLKNFLTGKEIIDFLIAISLGTILFYFLINISELKLLSIGSLLKEIMYNLVLGIVAWFLFQKYGFKQRGAFL